METILLVIAVVLFLLSGFAWYQPMEGPGRYGPSLVALGLAAFAGAFLAPLV